MANLIDILAVGAIDSTGEALDSGRAYVYKLDTTQLASVYSDKELTDPVANPVVLDSGGRAEVYVNESVRVLLEDSLGNQVDDIAQVISDDSSTSVITDDTSSTDNTLPRYNGTSGRKIQNSNVVLDDNDNIIIPGDLTVAGTTNLNVTSVSGISAKDLAVGYEFEGPSGGASTTEEAFAKAINQGGIINAISLSSEDFNENAFDSSNKKFGTYSFSMNGSRALAQSGVHNNRVKGSLSAWIRNLATSDGIACNPLLGINLALDSSGFLEAKITEAIAASETAKTVHTITGTTDRSADTTFRNVCLKWRTNDEAGASSDLLELEYQGAEEGTQLTSQDIDINPGDGGIWFIGAKLNEPTWDHVSAMSVLPDDETTDPWTLNGTDTNNSVSNGVLTIDTTTGGGTSTSYYERTDLVDLSQQTIEFKVQVDAIDPSTQGVNSCIFRMADASMDRGVTITFHKERLEFFMAASTATTYHRATVYKDFTKPRVIRFTSEGTPSPTMKIYVDGLLEVEYDNDQNPSVGSDLIRFGDQNATSASNATSQWEYFKIYDGGAEAPISLATQGNLDSVGITNTVISDATLALLQTNSITDVFGTQPNHGIYRMPFRRLAYGVTTSTNSTTFEAQTEHTVYFFGDGLSEQRIDFHGSITHSQAGGNCYVGIDVDGDIEGLDETEEQAFSTLAEDPDANTDMVVSLFRKIIATPGLHSTTFSLSTTSGTIRTLERTLKMSTEVSNQKKMGG